MKFILLIILSLTLVGHTSLAPKIPSRVNIPAIDSKREYVVNKVAGDTYVITSANYLAMFSVTKDGVVLFDAPQEMSGFLDKAIRTVTDQPVKHMIYSHAHTDHIGAAYLFKTAQIYGHTDAAELIRFANSPSRPVPSRTFREELALNLGGLAINLRYHGPNHDPGNIFIYLPTEKILMAVDLTDPGHVPYLSLNLSDHIPGYVRSFEHILSYDFAHFVPGHWQVGTREDVEIGGEYIADVQKSLGAAISRTNYESYTSSLKGMERHAQLGLWTETVVNACAKEVLSKWTDILGGVRQFTRSHCEAMMAYVID